MKNLLVLLLLISFQGVYSQDEDDDQSDCVAKSCVAPIPKKCSDYCKSRTLNILTEAELIEIGLDRKSISAIMKYRQKRQTNSVESKSLEEVISPKAYIKYAAEFD